MNLIEQYREDEQRGTFIALADIAAG